MVQVVVTGAAGFIGMHVCERLLARGDHVLGIDNFNPYYETKLKEDRTARLLARPGFQLLRLDISETEALKAAVHASGATRMVHLAAQAGVRYSIENPHAYQQANLAGHLNILEACRHQPGFEHLVYASSSSVYGDRSLAGAFSEDDPVDAPVSLYAATKRAGELMSTAYGKLYGMKQTGLRFFTVYGPWGRPDMAYFGFTQKILSGQPIEVFGEGKMARDFTYIDDIVDGIIGALDRPPEAGVNRILNIGDSSPVGLMDMIKTLESALGVEAVKIMKPMQPGDVTATYADVSKLKALTGYAPSIPISEGLPKFVSWYRSYYGNRLGV